MNRLAPVSSLFAAAVIACASLGVAVAQDAPLPPPPASILPPVNDPTPPKAAEGWKAETVMAYPQINTPSVVCAIPDGRVLVAEHPLSNVGGKTPIDRILCIHPDGRVSVFADGLYAVFGLAYVDGKVYVHHYPVFSVFTDKDSVGVDRKEIIDQTGKPTIGGLNDHIAAQIRLAMDGYFYMDTGDRGVWAAKSNVDGRVADLQGGGALRIRPDGTDMEVYSTGTRNHLDLSINAEDDLFSYDNTDDGHGWWTRFTHLVDGGYYGYPWDYKPDETKVPSAKSGYKPENPDQPFQPYTLWRMAEYGGGSPTGAVGYNEDALPAQFRGNLFHCEWGKAKVKRFAVERDGGTYKMKEVQDLLTKPEGGDLRPTGICVTEDGTGFYVTDWGYGGWMQKKGAGRLVKLTWTGKSEAKAKPAWYVPAATAKPFTATTAELIDGLKHPAQSVRLVAQRRVAERGEDAIVPLTRLLRDKKAPAHARWHAVSALDVLRADKRAQDAIVSVVADNDDDASVRRQAMRQMGTRGVYNDALLNGLTSDGRNGSADDASLRFHAATAIGRSGRFPGQVTALLAHLDDKDLFTRYAVFTALNRIGRRAPELWPEIIKGLSSDNALVRERTTYALRNTYDNALVTALQSMVNDRATPARARSLALLALADLHRQVKYWNGQWWGTQPVGSPRPAKTEEWTGTAQVLKTIRDALNDQDLVVRGAAVEAVKVAPDPAAAEVLVKLYNESADRQVRKPLLQALAASKAKQATPLALDVLKQPAGNEALIPDAIEIAGASGAKEAVPALIGLAESAATPEIAVRAVEALGDMKATAAVPAVAKQLDHKETYVATAAANALAHIGGDAAADALAGVLQSDRADVAKAAAQGLGSMKAQRAVPALLAAAKKSKIRNEAVTALAKIPSADALDVYIDALAGNNAGLKKQVASAIGSIAAEVRPTIDQRAAAGTLPKSAIPSLQEVFDTPAPITAWQMVGPFVRGKPGPLTPTDPSTYPAKDAEIPGIGGKKLKWQTVKASRDEHGMINVGSQVQPQDSVDVYLLAEVTSPVERDVDLLIGSDDFHTVWLNGNQLSDDTSNSGWNFDEKRVKGKLIAGKNVILARAGNDSGGYQFSLAISGDRTGPLFGTVVAKKPVAADFEKFALAAKGDVANGSKVFYDAQTVACSKCHAAAVGDGGGIVGPSLAGVGAKYDRAKLIESVLYPSKQIFDGYHQHIIRTKKGDVLAGVIQAESEADVTLYDAQAQKFVIKKSDIDRRKESPLSAMPEGLEQALSTQEFADLIEYLVSLKEAPPAAPKK